MAPSKRKPVKKPRAPKRKVAKRSKQTVLRVPALEVRQTGQRTLYTFAIDGKVVQSFAAISRIRRTSSESIAGYQRPEALGHISQIRRYLESADPLLPNAVVLAFDRTIRFIPSRGTRGSQYSRFGTLEIPVIADCSEAEKPAWVVDGQQRLAAIADSNLESFPICAVGFVAATDADQREQFMLVNSTKPLPKGLLYELLPSVSTRLPTALEGRKLPAQILERLNYHPGSPFERLIQTATNPDGVIKDNSVLRMLENSLSDGVLYWYVDGRTRQPDIDQITAVLCSYWSAVRDTFPTAWALQPRKSRLMHGVGIVGMGILMDTIAGAHPREKHPAEIQFVKELGAISSACHWTAGYWQFSNGDRRKWNELQNTSRDIQLLSDHLREQYRARLWTSKVG